VRLSWLENAYLRTIFSAGDFERKVGRTDLVLAYNHGSLVGLCVQDNFLRILRIKVHTV